jgi:hypothetical protein
MVTNRLFMVNIPKIVMTRGWCNWHGFTHITPITW